MMKITSRWGLWLALMLLALSAGNAFAGGNPEETRKLIGVLQSDAGLQEKGVACRKLASMGTPEAIPVLAKLLADEKLSHLARFGLEAMPDPAAGAALREALGTLKGNQLVGAINSVGMRRDAEATAQLTEMLKNSDNAVVAAAAAALSRIANPAAVAALAAARQGAPAALQAQLGDASIACAEELKKQNKMAEAVAIYDDLRQQAGFPVYVRQAALQGAILTRQDAGASLLTETLTGNDPALAAVALRAARLLPGTAAIHKALSNILLNLPPEKQVPLIQAIGDRHDATATRDLVEVAKTGAPAARLAMVRALGHMQGGALAIDVLFDAAAHETGDLAEAARSSLAMLSYLGVEADITTKIRMGDAKVRRVAMVVASDRQIQGAVPGMLKAAKDTDPETRLAALVALKSVIGSADLGAVVEMMVKTQEAKERAAAKAALSAAFIRIKQKEGCAEPLLAALPQASAEAKCSLLELLAQVGGEKALAAVRTASGESEPQIRETALRAMCEWSTPEVLPDLVKLAQSAPDPRFKILALRGQLRVIPLMQATPAQKLAALQEAMGRIERAEDNYLALAALAQIPTLQALEVVSAKLGDPALQAEASIAAVAIGKQLVKTNPDAVAAAMRKVRTTDRTVMRDARQLLLQADPNAAPGMGQGKGKAANRQGKKNGQGKANGARKKANGNRN